MLLAIAVILVVLAGCSNGATAVDSGVQGSAIYGPTCPVQRVGGPSCERPYSGVIVFTRNGHEIARVRSSRAGQFRIGLAPGTYTVSSNGSGLPFVKPFDVVVREHAYTTITDMFDSGIR